MEGYITIPRITQAEAIARKSGKNSELIFIDPDDGNKVKVVLSTGVVKKLQVTIGENTGDVFVEA